MPPQDVQPAPKAKPKSWLANQRALVGLAIIVIAAIVLGLVLHSQSNSKTIPNGPLAYKYTQINSYTLKGSRGNDDLTFSKPVQLTSLQGAQNQQIVFAQFDAKNPIADIADLNATSLDLGHTLSASDKNAIGKAAQDTDSPSSSYLHRFVSQWMNSNYATTFSSVTTFTNPNIKNYAWTLNYSATVKPKTSHSSNYPPMSGQAVLAVGNTTIYYFMVDAVNYNWQNNQPTWQQVLNSIKIDQ